MKRNKQGGVWAMQQGRENSIDEVEENMYKLLRYRKSVKSIEENGGHTSDEVREMLKKDRNGN